MENEKKKTSKYVFTLKNIDIELVDKKYGILNKESNKSVMNITKLVDLSELENPQETISFLDESKRLYNCDVSMIDFNSRNKINSENSKYNCYWCRHFFITSPIGCPISYVSNKITKSYFSEISKETYIIKENITLSKLGKYKDSIKDKKNKNIPFIFTAVKDKANSNFNIYKENYFSTDGIFCSFNCAKAYIKDNKHNILYENSDILLTKLYNDIILSNKSRDINKIEINPAPHWRLLIEYGGNLSINQFRENFTKISYDFHGILRPCSYLYEKKFTFT